MKVLFLNTYDNYGGAARAAMRIMHGLQAQGVECQMLVKYKETCDPSVHSIDDFLPHNKAFKVLDWCARKVKNKWQHHKWRPYSSTRSSDYLSDLRSMDFHGALQKIDFDILHVHLTNERFFDLSELRDVNKPIVWTLHDSWAFTGLCHVFHECRKFEKHCGACPKLGSNRQNDLSWEIFSKKEEIYKGLKINLVTPSKWLANCVGNSQLLGNQYVEVIPNCLDTNLYHSYDRNIARAELHLDFDKRYILFGATNATGDANKGLGGLLKAIDFLVGRINNLELLVFGTNQEIKGISIPTKIFGYVRDEAMLAKLYSAAEVMVVPSLSETFGQTASEAMACGTPVVCFARTGIQEVVDHKKNGYAAKDEQDMATGIIWCLENNKDGHLSENARQKVLESYTIDKVCSQYKSVYSTLLK